MPLRLSLVASIVLLAGCSGGSPTPTPASANRPTFNVLDTITKPSVEADRIVFGALIDGVAMAPGVVVRNFFEDTRWADSGWSTMCWLASQPFNGQTFPPYESGAPCLLGVPSERRDFCADAYSPPSMKTLDPAHPDAVQPALDPADFDTEGAYKGWFSWQVEARTDCDASLRVIFRPLDAVAGDSSKDVEIGEWTYGGPDAEKSGATEVLDLILTDATPLKVGVTVPGDGAVVLRAEKMAGECGFGAALYSGIRLDPEPEFTGVVSPDRPVVELDVSRAMSSGSYTAFFMGCTEGLRVQLIQRGPPY